MGGCLGRLPQITLCHLRQEVHKSHCVIWGRERGGEHAEGIAETVESISDPEAVASEAVVSLQESEGCRRVQAEGLARRLQ